MGEYHILSACAVDRRDPECNVFHVDRRPLSNDKTVDVGLRCRFGTSINIEMLEM